MRAALVTLLLLAALAGCLREAPGPGGPGSASPGLPDDRPTEPTPPAEPTAGAPNATGPPAEPVPFRVLAVGDEAELAFPMRLVLSDPEEWAGFWRDHEKKRVAEDGATLPPGEPPAVDFAVERAIVVTLGEVPDACQTVRVTEAEKRGDVTTLTVTTYRAGPEADCAAATRQPYVMLALPQDGSEVVYRDVEVEGRPPDSG